MAAKSKTVEVNGDILDYVEFGRGEQNLVMIPGLSDGMRTVKGLHYVLAATYRRLAKDYKVFVFSRRRSIPQDWSTKDMAGNLDAAFRELGIEKPDILGLSMGGFISQHLAAEYGKNLGKIALVVTAAKLTPASAEIVREWINMVDNGAVFDVYRDTTEKTYTGKTLQKNRRMYPVLKLFARIKDPSRFIREAEACIGHDATGVLGGVTNETLVVGGKLDHIVGGDAAGMLSELIPGSAHYEYPDSGHGLFEEHKSDFEERILDFFNSR